MPKLYYRIILIVLTVACGMGAVVTTPFAMFAAMAFDAPGSEHQLGAWVVFLSALIAATPICGYDHRLAATLARWFPRKRHRAAAGRRGRPLSRRKGG
jgi:hypothetical protein